MERLTVALPKGRLLEPSVALFQRLGYDCAVGNNNSRQLLADEPEADPSRSGKRAAGGPVCCPSAGLDSPAGAGSGPLNLRFLLAKAADVPVYVEYGAADLGIAGLDILRESGRDVYEPLQLDFGHCRLVLAGAPHQQGRDFRLVSSVRVATKYPRLARAYFLQRGISAEIIPLTGSIELAPRVGLADLLVDVVQTGRTLRENGLVELAEIMTCQATVIVNRVAHRLRLAEIRHLLAAIELSMGDEEQGGRGAEGQGSRGNKERGSNG